MNQSNTIFFFLLAGFLIYITMRGKLPTYMGFLFATPKGAAALPGPGNATDQTAGVADAINTGIKIATVVGM